MRKIAVILSVSFVLAIFVGGDYLLSLINSNKTLVFGDYANRQKIYMIVFFSFWVCGAFACILSAYLTTASVGRR